MQLSIIAPPGSNKGVTDFPNRESKFVDGLINGCDGNDAANPYNSKYGGNITTSDGWLF
jgi:alpha-galactosyl-binding lectin